MPITLLVNNGNVPSGRLQDREKGSYPTHCDSHMGMEVAQKWALGVAQRQISGCLHSPPKKFFKSPADGSVNACLRQAQDNPNTIQSRGFFPRREGLDLNGAASPGIYPERGAAPRPARTRAPRCRVAKSGGAARGNLTCRRRGRVSPRTRIL